MGVWATLAVLLLFVATVDAGDGGVEFWREEFTMTCPESGKWFKNVGEKHPEGEKEYKLQYNGTTKGLYRCEYKEEDGGTTVRYYFYVKGKVCRNCFELDAVAFLFVILGDILGTAIVMVVIYKFTKKKSSAHSSKAPARSGGRAPLPAQSPHYEPLSAHNRSQDPYSFVNRTG